MRIFPNAPAASVATPTGVRSSPRSESSQATALVSTSCPVAHTTVSESLRIERRSSRPRGSYKRAIANAARRRSSGCCAFAIRWRARASKSRRSSMCSRLIISSTSDFESEGRPEAPPWALAKNGAPSAATSAATSAAVNASADASADTATMSRFRVWRGMASRYRSPSKAEDRALSRDRMNAEGTDSADQERETGQRV